MTEIKEKYSAEAVANFFIEKGKQDGINNMSPLKIQKLVYFGLGWCLALNNTDIIGGEDVQAWNYGPVIPSLYFSLRHYGKDTVKEPIPGWFGEIDEEGNEIAPASPAKIPEEDKAILKTLNAVWKSYKDRTPQQLVEITHRHNTPWKMHFKGGLRNVEIPKDTIKAFYEVLWTKSVA